MSTTDKLITNSKQRNITKNITNKKEYKPNFIKKDKREKIDRNPVKYPTQLRGIVRKVFKGTPKKPQSGNPNEVKIEMKSTIFRKRINGSLKIIKTPGKCITCYVPGEKSELKEFGSVLVERRSRRSLPGINWVVKRGWGDSNPVINRKQGRSKYGVAKPKK